uniref:Uncharacterized protein n=1 Tax=Micrurus paraensis TaxID=1970185 RepID=A0A2D4L5P7_9SAUR
MVINICLHKSGRSGREPARLKCVLVNAKETCYTDFSLSLEKERTYYINKYTAYIPGISSQLFFFQKINKIYNKSTVHLSTCAFLISFKKGDTASSPKTYLLIKL